MPVVILNHLGHGSPEGAFQKHLWDRITDKLLEEACGLLGCLASYFPPWSGQSQEAGGC